MLQQGARDAGLERFKRISVAMLGEPFPTVNCTEPNVPAGERLDRLRVAALQPR
jgi:hypothetical protein